MIISNRYNLQFHLYLETLLHSGNLFRIQRKDNLHHLVNCLIGSKEPLHWCNVLSMHESLETPMSFDYKRESCVRMKKSIGRTSNTDIDAHDSTNT